jgi:site-specific DNA recombinase
MSAHLTRRLRCAVYTRKSTEEGLDQEYNSIDAQRDAGHAYIASQRAEGWIPLADDYDDPAYSGGHIERPALQRLLPSNRLKSPRVTH